MNTQSNNQPHAEDVVIARIVKARGIRGELECVIDTEFPDRFSELNEVSVLMPGGTWLCLNLQDHWFHKGRVVLKFEGYDTMSAAQNLTGGRLMITEADQRSLADGEFFEHQVIGSEVVSVDGASLGQVTGLVRTGGTDLLAVRDNGGRERLIPFADDICTKVDVGAKRITVNPPEGLLEL